MFDKSLDKRRSSAFESRPAGHITPPAKETEDVEFLRDVADESISMDSEDTAEGVVIRFPPSPKLVSPPVVSTCADSHISAPVSDGERTVVRRNRQRANQTDLASMIAANRKSRVYAGFILTRTAREPLPEELPYVGTFLPLGTARKYPELLAFESLDYSHAYCNETLSSGMKQVIRPGKFRLVCESEFYSRWFSPFAIVAYVSLATLIGIVAYSLSN